MCPKCNSSDIRLDPLSWGSRIYRCRNCGFRSPLFPDTPLKEVEKKVKNAKKKLLGIKT
jgi:transposase-like protein